MKTPGAFAWVRFFVGARSADARDAGLARAAPHLQPPEGRVPAADANPLLLDFYLTDVTLAPDGHRVHYWIDGANEGDITAWSPHHIANLGARRAQGHARAARRAERAGPGQFNRTERDITIAAGRWRR